MTKKIILSLIALFTIALTPAFGDWPTADQAKDKSDREEARADREQNHYDEATEALDDHEWRRAIALFKDVARSAGAHADAAIYWTAYAQAKNGDRTDALATLLELQKAFPRSKYIEDAKSLDVEIRQNAGQTVVVEHESDDDVKLMALNGLMNTDPERAIPILENILHSPSSSPKMKDRALFVLSQTNSPRATDTLSRIAKDGSNRDLQSRALRYLGIMGGDNSRKILEDVYRTSGDVEVKRTVLKSFMISGDRARLFALARSEQDPKLRGDAVRQLGVMGARNELADLYNSETSIEVKKSIIQAMFIGGSADKLGDLARNEKNPELRIAAIRSLGLISGERTSPILKSLYDSDPNVDVRHAVITALFLHGDAKTLVALGRAEKNPDLRKAIVTKLSIMNSKDAADFLLDILNEK
ncbi:MAG TPA: HEAT repeat domain-containing protein [Thermoanaerobaculia bacterium]|jgi:HEAT repeat protein